MYVIVGPARSPMLGVPWGVCFAGGMELIFYPRILLGVLGCGTPIAPCTVWTGR